MRYGLTKIEMFTHDKVKPAEPKAEALANAIIALMQAEKALQDAQSKVPNETAQWDTKDYYAAEQEAWNRAADALHSADAAWNSLPRIPQ